MRIEHGSSLAFPVSWRINVQKSRDDSAEGETRAYDGDWLHASAGSLAKLSSDDVL